MNWLLLRGLGRERRHWHDFPSLLGRQLVGGRIHLIDVAGAGTERGRLPWPSVEWLARDIARRVPELATGEGWSLLGLSLGGMVSLSLCWLLPDSIQQAVIINASGRVSERGARFRLGAVPAFARLLLEASPRHRERGLLELTSALPPAAKSDYAERAVRIAFDSPVRRAAVMSQLLAAARFWPPPREGLRARLLFLGSRNDALVSPACSRALARLYGAPYDEHPHAGHDLPLDDPRWLCERIARFERARNLQLSPAAALEPRGHGETE